MRHSVKNSCYLAAVISFGLIGSRAEASFTNVTSETGIDYVHADQSSVPKNDDLDLDRETCTVVSNHAGAAAVDVNGDGWTDFLAARYNLPPVLYINQGDGTFVEEGIARGLASAVDASAFGAGDFDNDGDQDLFMVPHRGSRFFFFINDGTGNFTEEAVARGAALDTGTGEPHEGYSVGLVDYDLDGFLDVYVSEWGPTELDERDMHSVLLRNLGGDMAAHFENVTEAAGLLQPVGGSEQRGFSTAWADFDGDRFPDLALVADFGSSRFYWNNGGGTFTESTDASGVGIDEFGMGVAVADYDNDGDLDFYATSIYDQGLLDQFGTNTGNKLYQNIGNRKFVEVSDAANVSDVGWSWGAAFFEFDNDGDQDLIVTNGMDTFGCDDILYESALDDPTTLLQNNGSGRFFDISSASGISDNGLGKGIVVLDYDNDGDEDLIITNTFGSPVVYRSNASDSNREWIRLKLRGDTSNRDGIGATVMLTDDGNIQTLAYNPSNAYIGQREGFLHFGVGSTAGGTVDTLVINWPSGITQTIEDLDTNQLHMIDEPDLTLVAPVIITQTEGGNRGFGERVVLSVEALSDTKPLYIWEKDGEEIYGAVKSHFEIKSFQPFDAGVYRVRVINPIGESFSSAITLTTAIDISDHTIARWWNEFMLDAIRKDFPAPTIHGRNLYHVSTAMWDAYWAYDLEGWDRVLPVYHKEVLSPDDWGGDREAAQGEAISYASYRMLEKRYMNSVSSERTLYNIGWLMQELGYDTSVTTTDGNTPAAVGNRIAAEILAATINDGSNEANGYVDRSNYEAVNDPMVFKLDGAVMNDPNRWQPLAFDVRISQNGLPLEENVQSFVGVNWREVETFAIEKDTGITIAWDPGAPPLFGTDSHDEFVDAIVEVIRYSSLLDPDNSEMINVSPGALLNNSLGTNDGLGRSVNPYTGEAYASNMVKHADYGRLLAEFWADGPASETPPGHWNTLLNEVTDNPLFERKYMGQGDPIPELEWNVQSYLAINGAMHDGAVASWTLKRQYDYSRPVSMIRYLGGLGQSSDPSKPNYHPNGFPIVEGLIEIVTNESSADGERHEHLRFEIGEIAIRAWAGEPADSDTQTGGVDWILAERWLPYQRSTFVTPAFAAYVSGHSTFSRAGAEVMSLLTGSPFFPGGIGEFHFEKDEFLEFEIGPSEAVTLEWATYYDAADQAGLSRLYGGIHVRADDFIGRTLGARIGVEAFLKANELRNGAGGNSALANARLSYRFPNQNSTSLLTFEYANDRLRPIWRISSEEDAGPSGEEGVYFVLNNDSGTDESPQATVIVRSDDLVDVTVAGTVGETKGVSISFSITSDESKLISVRAWKGSVYDSVEASQNMAPEILVYKIEAETETLFASNSARIEGDQDSLIEVLALRHGIDSEDTDDIAAALAIPLSPGDYCIELRGGSIDEIATIEVEDVR